MLFVQKPEKKINNFVSKIKQNNKSIKLTLNNVNFINITNNILNIYINNSHDKNIINNIDNEILNIVIDNNNQWFKNNLDESKIKQYFRNSINLNQSIMSILISDIKHPLIFYNNKQYNNFDDLNIKNTNTINIEIEAQGLYFFKEKVGIRWILRIINIYNIESLIDQEDILPTKENIHLDWENTINEFVLKLDNDYNILKEKANFIKKLKENIVNDYENSKKLTDIEWNNSLNEISKKITKYYNGTLKIK